jgi:hypothetical protein
LLVNADRGIRLASVFLSSVSPASFSPFPLYLQHATLLI